MVFFNHATRSMTVKVVYYGPGLCGKTTNLKAIYASTSPRARGEMVSLNTETDRTLFFDLLPMDAGQVGGFRARLQLYTVPGQVFYNETRKLVLQGVDGIVFVVDSQSAMLESSRASLENLRENLAGLGLDLDRIPLVFQWNKRDLRAVTPVSELESLINPGGLPSFQAVASQGTGVFETLRGITRLALAHIKDHALGTGPVKPLAAPAPAAVQAEERPEDLDLEDLAGLEEILRLGEAPPAGAVPLPDEDEDLEVGPPPAAGTEAQARPAEAVLPLSLRLEGEDGPLEVTVQVASNGRMVGHGRLRLDGPLGTGRPVRLDLSRS